LTTEISIKTNEMTDPIADLKTYQFLRGLEDWPTWSAQVIEQAHQLRIAQYFEPTTEDVVELPEPYDLEPPIEPTEAQIEADHTKMTVYMHRLNLHETREKKVDPLTTFMKQTLDEKIRDRVRDTTMSSLGHGFVTPTQYYHAVWKTVRPNDQSHEILLKEEYRKHCRNNSKITNDWLNQWLSFEPKIKAYTWGQDVVEDFLNSLGDKHHYFAAPMSLHARLNKVGLADVIDQFGVHLAKMTSFNENIKGKSMETFQGRQDKDKDSNSNVSDRHERPERVQCPCGSKYFCHSPKHCYFLIPEKRPKDWMPNSILLERFDDGLK
jgi:hypothetical protein